MDVGVCDVGGEGVFQGRSGEPVTELLGGVCNEADFVPGDEVCGGDFVGSDEFGYVSDDGGERQTALFGDILDGEATLVEPVCLVQGINFRLLGSFHPARLLRLGDGCLCTGIEVVRGSEAVGGDS